MIIDNKNSFSSNDSIISVWDCIKQYTTPNERSGKMDIVTGFFSVAALHVLYKELSPENKYRIILGDIHDMARDEDFLKKAVNLLHGDVALESSFLLSATAKSAVEFLKQKTVEIKSIHNSFCHAKAYIYEDASDAMHDYGIVGSSNLTEAGLGIKQTSNVELNMVETGRDNHTVIDLKAWFEKQWEKVAKSKITVPIDGRFIDDFDAKEYLIEQIEKIFSVYTPKEIYQKILFEFFRADIEMNDSLEYRRDIEFLQKSVIWNTLFDFQKSGVVSLVKLLNRYGGAILADAVGLGKTFSALGVIKFFQNNGYNTVIFCPKKLKANWTKYGAMKNSRFKDDRFSYIVRSHTDLQDDRLDSYKDAALSDILSYDKLLIVVDESHNLRNHESCRYQMLLKDIINASAKKGHEVKVLLLSATPINTGLIDIRNQFKLIGYEENKHFYSELGLSGSDPLYTIFQQANKKYNNWAEDPSRTVNSLKKELHGVNKFFDITNELIIARNRAFVTAHESSLIFPKQRKPVNMHIGINEVGAYKTIEDMYDDMKILRLTAYQPTQYEYDLDPDFVNRANAIKTMVQNGDPLSGSVAGEEVDEANLYDALLSVSTENNSLDLQNMIAQNWVVKKTIIKANAGKISWDNSALRELSLAGMMISLFIKRLESCWAACLSTLKDVREKHDEWLTFAQNFQKGGASSKSRIDLGGGAFIEIDETIETIGKRTIDFNKMKRLDDFIKDLQRDIKILDSLIDNLKKYERDILTSYRSDDKLDALIDILRNKQENESNKKVVVFTSYADTAEYIYDNVVSAGIQAVSLVTGDEDSNILEEKLQRFAPYSKVFLEKWKKQFQDKGIDTEKYATDLDAYKDWIALMFSSEEYKEEQEILMNPINVLIATDCVSEGQNLQDADMVINYDIHWNPVRLIQRFGRIDRIGSPNAEIGSVNFWPSNDIEEYLNLSSRVSNRMVMMNIAGSETLKANKDIERMEKDNALREEQNARSLKAIHDDQIGQIEDLGPTMATLSLSDFMADAEACARENLKKLQEMPNGAFSGFRWKLEKYAEYPECLVALLRHREDVKSFHLLCLPVNSAATPTFAEMDKAEVLLLLREHQDESTYLPTDILSANPDKLKALAKVIRDWFETKSTAIVMDNINSMLDGNENQVTKGASDESMEKRIDIDKYDLIAWDYVSLKENNVE